MEYDVVNKPRHYNQGGIECIDALKAATVSKTGIEAVCTANAIKYLWRYEEKNGIEDVKKAMVIDGKQKYKYCPNCGAKMDKQNEPEN